MHLAPRPARRTGPGQRGACPRCREEGFPTAVLLHKATTAYVVVRAVRLLQARGHVPGRGGLAVRGRHVHHHLWGVLLVVAAMLARGASCLHSPWRANVLCTGTALVLDEYDVLLSGEGSAWTEPVRASLDVLGVAGAVAGAVHWRTTWSGWLRGAGRRSLHESNR